MTWTKTSDDFSDDCWSLSDAAYRLHHEGLTWSNRKLLDCRIPRDDLRRFAKRPEAVDELLACGYWTDEGDHYLIRHHAGYQRTREQVVRLQERNQRNGKAGGRPRKTPREVWEPETQSETQVGSHGAKPHGTQGDRTGQDRPGGGDPSPVPWKACVICESYDPCTCFDEED